MLSNGVLFERHFKYIVRLTTVSVVHDHQKGVQDRVPPHHPHGAVVSGVEVARKEPGRATPCARPPARPQ
jgi:hypothetical protein